MVTRGALAAQHRSAANDGRGQASRVAKPRHLDRLSDRSMAEDLKIEAVIACRKQEEAVVDRAWER